MRLPCQDNRVVEADDADRIYGVASNLRVVVLRHSQAEREELRSM